MKNEFDYTMLSTFLNCRRRYDYRINRGLVSKTPPMALTFGHGIHSALDSWYGDKDVEKAVAVFKSDFKEDPEADIKRTHVMGEWIIRNYDKQYRDQPWELVHSEMSFDLPLGDNRFIGRIDKIIKWGDCLWVVDHKAQPLDAKVLTPKGWTTMGELNKGDAITDSDGNISKVLGVYPQGYVDCYEVTFEDGVKVKCSKDHLWTVTHQSHNTPKTMTLENIAEKMNTAYGKDRRKNKLGVPVVKPVYYYRFINKLPIHPYLLGVLLGDGCISGHVVEVSIGDEDCNELVGHLFSCLPKNMTIERTSGDNFSWIIKMKKGSLRNNSLIKALKSLRLMGCKSNNKFVPKSYLTASLSERMELLRGLLDTDGCCYNGHIMFDTTSLALANDVAEIVRSVGGIARVRKRTGTKLQAYRVGIRLSGCLIPFKLKRKVKKLRPLKAKMLRYIKSIKKLPKQERMQCITTSKRDGLYVTNDFTLTHNTTSELGANFFKKAEPNLQFTGYVWAARQLGFNTVGVILDAVLVAKGLLPNDTIPGSRKNYKLTPCARYDVYRNEEHLSEWRVVAESIIKDIQECEEKKVWYPNFDMCTYYGECPFRKVCKEERDIRERIIASDYDVEFWSPKNEQPESQQRDNSSTAAVS